MTDEQDVVLLAEGFHRGFLGLTQEWNGRTRSVYDYERCVRVLTKRDKMTDEEAREFMDFNVVGSYVGEATPLFVRRMTIKQI